MRLLIIILFVGFSGQCQEFVSHKVEDRDTEIPIGSTCYDINSQMLLDQALENGIKCESTLAEARKWRDNYKSQLEQSGEKIIYKEVPVETEANKLTTGNKLAITGGAVGVFLLGLLVGAQ